MPEERRRWPPLSLEASASFEGSSRIRLRGLVIASQPGGARVSGEAGIDAHVLRVNAIETSGSGWLTPGGTKEVAGGEDGQRREGEAA